ARPHAAPLTTATSAGPSRSLFARARVPAFARLRLAARRPTFVGLLAYPLLPAREGLMVVVLQYLTAGLYLLASLTAGAGFTLARPAMLRVAVGVLAAGAIAHAASFTLLHTVTAAPPLTHLPSALSFMALVGTVGFLLLAWRARLAGLVALVAPMSWLRGAAGGFSGPARVAEPRGG